MFLPLFPVLGKLSLHPRACHQSIIWLHKVYPPDFPWPTTRGPGMKGNLLDECEEGRWWRWCCDKGICFVVWLCSLSWDKAIRPQNTAFIPQKAKTETYADVSYYLLSQKQNIPQARDNSFQGDSHRKTGIKGRGGTNAWQNTSHKKKKKKEKNRGSEVLFCWADCFDICIPGGLLKIKVLIDSCHHLLKRPELKERKKSLD